jgi:tRNA(Ile2) C34 agmatinyltransferase TiaS
LSITRFNRLYNRTVVTMPGEFICCVCRARAGYRLQSGSRVIYRCPACANSYDNREWKSEALPHIARQGEELIYEAYKFNRQRLSQVTPQELGEMFVLTFKPRLEQLEARYQAELAGRRAS